MTVEGQLYLILISAFAVADLVIFAIFAVIAKKKSRNVYVVGSVAVVLFACLQAWYLMKDSGRMLLSEQVDILFQGVGVPFLLAMLVVGAVGTIASGLSKS
jgi:hypothetical protein